MRHVGATALEVVQRALRDVPARLGIAGDNMAFRVIGPRSFFCAVRWDALLRRPCGMLVEHDGEVCWRHGYACAACQRAAVLSLRPFPHSFQGVVAEWHDPR